jgi:hypothetical protein
MKNNPQFTAVNHILKLSNYRRCISCFFYFRNTNRPEGEMLHYGIPDNIKLLTPVTHIKNDNHIVIEWIR